MKKGILSGVIIGVIVMATGFAIPALAHGPGSHGKNTDSVGVYLDQPTLTRLAQALNLTADQLLVDLEQGKALSQIASEQGVSGETLVEAIGGPYRDELQLRVSYGYLSQDQADALLAKAEEHPRTMLDQDLSSPNGETEDWWQDMADYCNGMMDSNRSGTDNMMKGSDWGNTTTRGENGMMGGNWSNTSGKSGNGTTNDGWAAKIRAGLHSMTHGLGGMMGSGGMM